MVTTFVATGDSFITRRLSDRSESYAALASIIRRADVCFTNLEITTHHYEGFPGAVSGGTWAIAPPEVLGDLRDYGFNLIAWANNHSLDYSYGGLEATERYLNAYKFIHAGCGPDLARASEPRYLDTASGRVALIAATSTFDRTWIAGEQRADMMGRPGVNPLRHQVIHVISPEKLRQLTAIADAVGINTLYHYAVQNGYMKELDPGQVRFGDYVFQAGEKECQRTTPYERDMKRILKSVAEAKRQADYVLVSIHSHETKGEHLDEPADFISIFARQCIDAGAHAIIGHGPHKVGGIEIYQGRPIFYSLGNFIFQNETVAHLPSDYYEKFGLSSEHNVADAFDQRGLNDTRGFAANPSIWASIVPHWTMEDGEVRDITLYPIELGYGKPRYQRGWPQLTKDNAVLKKVCKLSEVYGTSVTIENHVGRIVLER
ncbi:CapA family protein [Ammoniphilus sp. YIM 78166]|uniref:CapA family protein n=1 Tax=Ammoniphilus sp. YIM 78166 TaxID=1644106 RepID=UPI00107013A0|nr:CapA family protein [Ammoniphilus sp. YIM 78166]